MKNLAALGKKKSCVLIYLLKQTSSTLHHIPDTFWNSASVYQYHSVLLFYINLL